MTKPSEEQEAAGTVKMRWVDGEPEARPRPLSDLVSVLDAGSAVNLIANLGAGVRLYVARSCLEAVFRHCSSSRHEVGGLLLGYAFEQEKNQRGKAGGEADVVTVVTRSLSSVQFQNSAVSLRMEAEIWTRADAHLRAGEMVVGWYHSHPDLGAFFSGTDGATQRAFFGHPYSVGWVIDPFRREHAVFTGSECDRYGLPLVLLPDGLVRQLALRPQDGEDENGAGGGGEPGFLSVVARGMPGTKEGWSNMEGWRPRLRFPLGFGFQRHFWERGRAWSWGVPGFRIGRTSAGRTWVSLGLPFLGLYFTRWLGGRNAHSSERGGRSRRRRYSSDSPAWPPATGGPKRWRDLR